MKNINELSPVKQRFYMVFKSTGLTQAEFGRILGKSQNQISAIINNRSSVSADMIQLLRYKLNVNPEYILHGATPMFLPKKIESGAIIPIIADIPAGDWRFWLDSYAAGTGDDYVAAPDVKGSQLFAVRVDGDSMEPKLYKGDILIINPDLEFDGGLAVVRHVWEDIHLAYKIRNVRRLSPKRFLLVPLNPKYADEEITPGPDTHFYVPVKRISVSDI